MRFINKYKKISKLDRFNYPKFPLRILKFRRPKWSKLQKQVLGFQKSDCNFVNPLILKLSYKQWDKVQNYYKSGIQIKRKILALFDDSISLKSIKKQLSQGLKSNNSIFLSVLVKPEFRIDILLWRLNFFSSSFQARQSINEKKITVNGKFVSGNLFLEKGDVVAFDPTHSSLLDLSLIMARLYNHQKACTFVEIDFYTQTLVVIKNPNEFTSDDFNLLINEYVDLKKLRDYL